LRKWQEDALRRFRARTEPDFLAVATPGAGKTTFALVAARVALAGTRNRVVIVVPTRHLRTQWAAAARRFGLALLAEWDPREGLPADVHGVCTTYQQVASNPTAVGRVAAGGLVVLDEIHHAGADRAWGDALLTAFSGSARRLSLSGTPFRSDTSAIPFVTYLLDMARPDVEYGYAEALADGVVRPVFFPRFDGHMEWTAPDGARIDATFDQALATDLANQRLRTALSPNGEWLPAVLDQANRRLASLRASDPAAAGLVLTIDQDHARQVAQLLRRVGADPVVATSDDPDATDRIAAFASGRLPWLVAVRMVSEGVDIPRLRVAVWATVTTSELFFRQAVGRIARVTGAPDQRAWMFLPDDPRLRLHAERLAEARRHELRRREDPETGDVAFDKARDHEPEPDDGAEQLSLFEAHAARYLGSPGEAAAADVAFDAWDASTLLSPVVEFDLGALPPPLVAAPPVAAATSEGAGTVDHSGQRRRLRELNAQLATDVARLAGLTHAQANRELNRLAGITSVGGATSAQLARRLDVGRAWLVRLNRR
jgi:superfamily II DNA or RNA helicase